MGKWHLIQNQPYLRNIFKEPPLISYRKGKSLYDILVRATKAVEINLFVNCRRHAGPSPPISIPESTGFFVSGWSPGECPIVSPGDQPLTKKPEDSGCRIFIFRHRFFAGFFLKQFLCRNFFGGKSPPPPLPLFFLTSITYQSVAIEK